MKKRPVHCQAGRGITLVEMMVTLSVLALLLAMAVPSYRSSMEGNRRTTYANQLLEDMALARSEAIKRNARVVVCPSFTGTTCSGSDNWAAGWIVFVDNIPYNNARDVADPLESVLRVHDALALPTGWTAKHNVSPFIASFLPSGAIASRPFSICVMVDADQATNCDATTISTYAGKYANLVVSQVGRLRIQSQ